MSKPRICPQLVVLKLEPSHGGLSDEYNKDYGSVIYFAPLLSRLWLPSFSIERALVWVHK